MWLYIADFAAVTYNWLHALAKVLHYVTLPRSIVHNKYTAQLAIAIATYLL